MMAGLACGAHAASEGAPRLPPTRPAPAAPPPTVVSPLALRRIGRIDYVHLADVARRLDLKLTWVDRGRKATLSGPGALAVFERDNRDIVANGLRIFLGDSVVDAGGQLYVSRVDFECCIAPLLRPGHGVPAMPPPKIIALDPGHGGKDNGTSVNEKVYALDVAQRAKKLLEAAGLRVVLTRDRDTFVELTQRPAIANASRADLFVSIHFNALARDSKTSGVEMFTFAPQWQRSAEAWSPLRKNDTEDFLSPGNRFDHWNTVLAQAIHRRFVTDLKTFDRGKKLAHWGVLRPLNCPGVLVECGFLTSDIESRKIATPAYRQQLAEAIADGVMDYASTLERLRPRA
ncbi:MAG TPA: N-acetylmuramoyl-L-alanine amidase [Opitutaceae bacterium]|nr:N-acetylmuramoyl-L-alanine amidase [Opitutaceae bacterium]